MFCSFERWRSRSRSTKTRAIVEFSLLPIEFAPFSLAPTPQLSRPRRRPPHFLATAPHRVDVDDRDDVPRGDPQRPQARGGIRDGRGERRPRERGPARAADERAGGGLGRTGEGDDVRERARPRWEVGHGWCGVERERKGSLTLSSLDGGVKSVGSCDGEETSSGGQRKKKSFSSSEH